MNSCKQSVWYILKCIKDISKSEEDTVSTYKQQNTDIQPSVSHFISSCEYEHV